ncbi:hypothetical protein J2TS6_42730 [Paenibacillus albilobatus]|uniref:IraD/Gp25-like domain-containing protein n=1 Tax=Paenibacillus albilobatus TaxID=2716884 RepID=A0A920CDT6_9BACL|nr:lysozyme [Paenibacillus albilobatus]GIO33132.1 hypothetical protein J2TS6_42730 [Paenibacillus albilobatus]
MNEHVIVVKSMPEIRLGLTGIESIEQNIGIVCSTYIMSVPLDRSFGIDPSNLDEPEPILEALLTNEIMTAIQECEPRAQVTRITFLESDDPGDGGIYPVVAFTAKEDG